MTTNTKPTPKEFWIEFDEDAIEAWLETHQGTYYPGRIDCARWQHQQDLSALEAAEGEIERLKEALSYLPKVPTQPYEKELASELDRYKWALETAKRQRDLCYRTSKLVEGEGDYHEGTLCMNGELEEILAGDKANE